MRSGLRSREYRPKVAKDRFRYARMFYRCLLDRDLSELRDCSVGKREHGMRALAFLSRYLGMHDEFKALIRSYGLKWSNGNSDDLIIARLTKSANREELFDWLAEVKAKIPLISGFVDSSLLLV
jgi:hypothetical protein